MQDLPPLTARFIEAAKNGSAIDVKACLEEGADVNHLFPVAQHHCTALGFALARGEINVVHTLLRWHADCEIQNTVPGKGNETIRANALVQVIESQKPALFYALIHGGANYYSRDYLDDLSRLKTSEAKIMSDTLALQLARDGITEFSEYHDPNSRIAKMHAFNKRRESVKPAIGTARTNIFPGETTGSQESTPRHPIAEGVSMAKSKQS